jgi:hypothetical protein
MHNLDRGKSSQKYMGYFCNLKKSAQSKQTPNMRKFAQSGKPGQTNLSVTLF